MKRVEEFNIISFESTHMAIKSEKILLEEKLEVRIIPVPREITASCGLALKISKEDFKRGLELLKCNNIELSGCYSVKKIGLKKEILDISEEIL